MHLVTHATLLLTCLFLTGSLPAHAAATPTQPLNILLILADDLGWSDLHCQGGDNIQTPHLDRFSSQSVRFTHAYSPSPVCTPTRASLLTGQHPARLHMTIWSEGALRPPQNRKLREATSLPSLPLEHITIAELLQMAGYSTALIGKWHLGDADHSPETQGFNLNIGGTHWGAPASYFWPFRGSGRFGAEFRYVPGLGVGQTNDYLTDRLTDEAIRFLEKSARSSQPFFLFLAHHTPHTPIEPKPADLHTARLKIQKGSRHQNPSYNAMIHNLDFNVGRVLQKLRRLGLERNTLVVFASDNGGYIGTDSRSPEKIPVTDNHPLRSGKGTCYEGGIRVPLIIRWPGIGQKGAVCSAPVILTDLFPTFVRAARIQLPANSPRPVDGEDLTSRLQNPSTPHPPRTLTFHYPHYYHAPPTAPMGAIRSGPWKLIEHFENGQTKLFNLQDDPSESRDLSTQQPQKKSELLTQLRHWRESVQAHMPTPNPQYIPTQIP